ncbi:hypothetical protein I41_19650 [Lacipirellula limnantheis]|uniref:Uncharacterized protein n=1 Tax=Lacipirellula limnantheis TaxID=2528024 RepID=A0A517TWM4_9BACT|nr:hypothetical protein I41_19650 [Lacipirellula limnantheis]
MIGWLWIVISVATLFSSLEDFFTARKFAAARPDLGNDAASEATLDAFASLIGGTPAELLALTLISAVAIAGGVGLLKLRSSGRHTLIGFSWLLLVGSLIGVPYYLWIVVGTANEAADGLDAVVIVMCIMGLLQLFFNVFIFGLMLRSLHGPRIREAVAANETLRATRAGVAGS